MKFLSSFNSMFPKTRMRRMRKNNFTRALMRENVLTTNDLIYPLFLIEGTNKSEQVISMPGVERRSLDLILKTLEDCINLGIKIIALFPVIDPSLKKTDGIESINPEGLLPKAIREIKNKFPELGILTDIALDPYTSHGHDGIIDENGYVLNDKTNEILVKQSLLHAESGSDILAPSDMMDGRIGLIRSELENKKFFNTLIMSYSAKYASAFYGPFRDAIKSKKNLGNNSKNTYQMDPGNSNESLNEVALDIAEGADMIMIKPGLPYLDIIKQTKDIFKIPTFAYQVSGEYSMIVAAAKNDWISFENCILESSICFKRAGADGILTYFARDLAKILKNH